MCAFRTIYPGWYSSRTVHIHLRAHLGERTATTQLYFPDEVTDEVFTVSPYARRPRRDTTNDTDSARGPVEADLSDPATLAARLEATPGVVGHGLFAPNLVSEVIVGRGDRVERLAGSRRASGAG